MFDVRLLQHFDFSVVKAVLVASPGFVKDEFLKYSESPICV
jgi:hypothetical protein